MRKSEEIQGRAFRFACEIVALHDSLVQRGDSARTISRQLLRSGTSIGANLEEADGAQSKPDFASKCAIALKEARETHYWLRLLHATAKIDCAALLGECNEIIAILTTIVRKTRGE